LAIAALGNAGAVAFLNRHHDGLDGRPLDLAVVSEAGLAAVEAVLGANELSGRRIREVAVDAILPDSPVTLEDAEIDVMERNRIMRSATYH
jgi:hypothetical protein